ncbi:hypothetical protein KIN20_015131 [Parelaphostrongylus tenuis]|uniref:Uncharacterized protein n=1 Tax=Parelaphostrongylus tenuis TaxID=148309 RepID=A0AAD5N3W5_PARTN|nr:hypothetical protein KIN20_015131 [Parelaphostrongylus tenuis]
MWCNATRSRCIEVLEQQGRSAGLPDVIISNILDQLTVQINYDPLECKTLSVLKPGETMVNGVRMMDMLPNCIIVGNTVTALCTAVNAGGRQMCDLSMADHKIANIPPKHLSISGTFTVQFRLLPQLLKPILYARQEDLMKSVWVCCLIFSLHRNGLDFNEPLRSVVLGTKLFFPLADIKPRKDGLSGAYAQSAPPAERILDAQEIVDFDKSMRKLRLNVSRLPKDRFSTGEQEITEKQWSVGKTFNIALYTFFF